MKYNVGFTKNVTNTSKYIDNYSERLAEDLVNISVDRNDQCLYDEDIKL